MSFELTLVETFGFKCNIGTLVFDFEALVTVDPKTIKDQNGFFCDPMYVSSIQQNDLSLKSCKLEK